MMNSIIVHENPVWTDKANFIIHAKINNPPQGSPIESEQLWTKKITENTFEICCIPFFLYNINLDDIVTTHQIGNKKHVLNDIMQSSGHTTFRVWFKDIKMYKTIFNWLNNAGCLLEWRFPSSELLAISIPLEVNIQSIADYLYAQEQQLVLVYETGN